MAIVLGPNRYGKAEIRLVRVSRGNGRHEIRDLNVSVTLTGDMTAAHLTGDNAAVLPTDTQKNTVYAFAAEHGVGPIESFALRLARHFVESQPTIATARVSVAEHGWDRIAAHRPLVRPRRRRGQDRDGHLRRHAPRGRSPG